MSKKLILFCVIAGLLIGLLPLLLNIPVKREIIPVPGDRILKEIRKTETDVSYELIE
ncbi:hypothetical protein ES705_45810 [subsurface metagenome]